MESPAIGGPFHATRTWNLLISYLKENANIKRRRNLKMQCGESFTGLNAVDVLFHFVRNNPEHFSTKSVKRENIVRLCQSFLDNKVFEYAFDKKCTKFEDSASMLYSFSDEISDVILSKTKRQALKEIDGEIMNGMDQIAISDPRFMTPRSKNLQIPGRKQSPRSRFHSFGRKTASSFKDTFMRFPSSESDEDQNDVQIPDPRSGRKLKRSSSLVGYVVKRSSSDSNLRKDYTSSSSDCENKESENKGSRLKFGQRLSFRKKSLSSLQQLLTTTTAATTTTTKVENNNNKVTDLYAFSSRKENCKPPVVLHKYTKTNENNCKPIPVQKHCFDPRRRSLAVKSECSKPPRSLRRMLSSPALSNRNRRTRQSYDLSKHTTQLLEHKTPKPSLKHRIPSHCEPEDYPSPPKIIKKEHPIKETPSRLSKASGYLSSIAGFANRMSIKRTSYRRSEQSTSHVNHSCVIKNPLANTGTKQRDHLEKKLNPQECAHIRRECIRVRLLQILDLPFVDCLITSPTSEKKEKDKFTWNNLSSSLQYSQVAVSFKSDDNWINYALAVLRYLPNGYEILCKNAREHSYNKKLQLYCAIADYYKSLSKPLIDDSMTEIVEIITNMLASKPVSETLEVVQLFLHLLPDSVFAELRDLTTFLQCVSERDDIKLLIRGKNKRLILQEFPRIIFSSGSQDRYSSEASSSPLLLFMMHNIDTVFLMPFGTKNTIQRKIEMIESGEVDSPSFLQQEVTFCEMITSNEYAKQSGEYTQMQIADLAKSFLTSNVVNEKKKKMFLKKLQSSHSSVYEKSKGPIKALPTSGNLVVAQQPKILVKQRPIQAPSSDPLSRRKNKSKYPIYV